MPERGVEKLFPEVPQMRAATRPERLADLIRSVYEGAADQPLAKVLDLLGATNIRGMVDEFTQPNTGMRIAQMPDGPTKGIRAFHGSPHDFDQFSLSKIGTGEGAQAYGHGLYFADNEQVARSYKVDGRNYKIGDKLVPSKSWGDLDTSDPEQIAAKAHSYFGSDSKASDGLYLAEKHGNLAGEPIDPSVLRKAREIIDAGIARQPGRMYEVNIKADPADFLDWDAPLSQQPKVAQKLGLPQRPSDDEIDSLITRLRAEVGPERLAQHPEFKAMEARLDATRDMELPGESAYRDWQRPGTDAGRESFRSGGISSGPEAATSYLRNRGIPGIKYLDGASRGKGEGSRNYVVFDDSLIDIVRKYGLAVAVAKGLIDPDTAEQIKARLK